MYTEFNQGQFYTQQTQIFKTSVKEAMSEIRLRTVIYTCYQGKYLCD